MKLKKNPVQGPTSSAGLVRYFDISGGGIEVTPELIVGVAVFIVIVEIAISVLL